MAVNNEIKVMSPSLQFLVNMLSYFNVKAIEIPGEYRAKVVAVKQLLEDDPSGLTNSILDFATTCALVDYRIEVEDNDELERILNDWLRKVNLLVNSQDGVKSIPTGLPALTKEYFRERWKGSSNLLLRSFWDEVEGLELPTTLFFVNGEDIKIKTKSKDNIIRLGDEKYFIRVNENESSDIPLPSGKDEYIFAQKPYESWGTKETVPFLIRRGVYRNSKFLQLMSEKGEQIVAKALEYLMLLKKGTEKLALEGNVNYNEADLKKINQDLIDIVNRKKNEDGFVSYATQFDTSIEHLIPDYDKVLKGDLTSPMEKRILAGLGLVEIVEGTASTRREGILNPKPLIGEISQGIEDYKSLLTDIIHVIVQKNIKTHPKWMNANIRVMSSPVTQFLDDKARTLLRSLYDRGSLSKRTLVETIGDLDYDLEKQRRKQEKTDGDEKLMFAPVIQNQGLKPGQVPSKSGPEAKNFTAASEEITCPECGHNFEIKIDDTNQEDVTCPNCNTPVKLDEQLSESSLDYEEAPYNTNKDIKFKGLPSGAKTIFRKAFNNALKQYGDETTAFKVAWSAVKTVYTKIGEKWVRKSKGEIEKSLVGTSIEDLIELKKLEILKKQDKLITGLIEKAKEEDKDENI